MTVTGGWPPSQPRTEAPVAAISRRNLGCKHPSDVFRMGGTRGGRGLHHRMKPQQQKLRSTLRNPAGRERGPAAGTLSDTRPAEEIRPPKSREPTSRRPLSCSGTAVGRKGRCPDPASLANISGEHNYTAPPAEQPSAAPGGGGGSGQ